MMNLKTSILIFGAICANCLGQQQLSCVTNGATNTPVRAEGLAEMVGDLVVTCTGGVPTPPGTPVPVADIKISLNTTITSKLLAPYWPEALLLVDEPAPAAQRVCGTSGDVETLPGVCRITGTGIGTGVYSGAPGRPNVFQGTIFGSDVVLFTGIPIDPPGTGSARQIRITNVRANANALGGFSAIVETINATPTSVLPLIGLASQAVGSVQPGLSSSVLVGTPLQQNIPENPGLAADPNSSGVSQFKLRFRSLFSTAFKRRNIATAAVTPDALANQNNLMLGTYNTESNFYNNSFPTVSDHGNLALAGLANSSTRLMARFAPVPTGVLLFAQASGSFGNYSFKMVHADVNGAGPYTPVVPNVFGIAPIPVVNGVATVVYEVLGSDPNAFATLDIPIYVAYNGTPGLGTAAVNMSFAPLSNVTQASATEPVPRFADTSTGQNAFTIVAAPCATLGASSASIGGAGGSGSTPVTGASSCTWFPVTFDNWIAVSGDPHSGSGSLGYTVSANNSPFPRSGSILLRLVQPFSSDQTFTINQAATACTYASSPVPNPFASAGGTGSIKVTPNSSLCDWTPVSNAAWITVAAASGGYVGGTTIGYSVATNTGATRTGTITIEGQTFTITQQGPGQNIPSPVSATPASGGAYLQTFDFTFADPDGWQDLSVVNILINNFLDGRQGCYIAFLPSGPTSGTVLLVDDAGNAGGPFDAMVLPGSGPISNTQCSISGIGSSVSASGNSLTLRLKISFTAFFGTKVVHVAARDGASHNSGWQALGVWTVPIPAHPGPWVLDGSPGRASTASQTYTFTFAHSNGFADLAIVNILVNQFLDGRNGCYVAYVPSGPTTGTLLLVNDAGDAGGPFQSMQIPGSGSVQNSQCSISGAGSSATGSGNTLSLTLPITFSPEFAGSRVIYAAARSNTETSGWQAVGSVTVP